MTYPIPFVVQSKTSPTVFHTTFRAEDLEQLRGESQAALPTFVLVRRAATIASMDAGLINPADVIGVLGASADDVLLVVMPEEDTPKTIRSPSASGDAAFLSSVASKATSAPHLNELAKLVMKLVRQAGVEGELREAGGGKWVNSPINSFTLKVQPVAKSLRFTIYGNPHSYDINDADFLKPDQNSYSGGLIVNEKDAHRFAKLVLQAHNRKR